MRLSLEWSEAVVSCAGSVTYTLSATPCLSVSGDCEVAGGRQTTSTTETGITLSVDGSVGLEYDFTVSTCANTSSVYSVDLKVTGISVLQLGMILHIAIMTFQYSYWWWK